MANKNYFPVDGILHDKPVLSGTSKKGKPYSILSFVLEIKGMYEKDGKTIEDNQFTEFRMTKTVQSKLGQFEIGDPVTVGFKLGGRKYTTVNGERYSNEPLACTLNHSDIENGQRPQKPKEEKNDYSKFMVNMPNPNEEQQQTDYDNLPF